MLGPFQPLSHHWLPTPNPSHSLNHFTSIFLKSYLFERQGCIQRESKRRPERRGEESFICWFSPQMAAKPRAGLGYSQEHGTVSGFPMWWKWPKVWGIFCYCSGCVRMELDQKCSSQAMNQPHVGCRHCCKWCHNTETQHWPVFSIQCIARSQWQSPCAFHIFEI